MYHFEISLFNIGSLLQIENKQEQDKMSNAMLKDLKQLVLEFLTRCVAILQNQKCHETYMVFIGNLSPLENGRAHAINSTISDYKAVSRFFVSYELSKDHKLTPKMLEILFKIIRSMTPSLFTLLPPDTYGRTPEGKLFVILDDNHGVVWTQEMGDVSLLYHLSCIQEDVCARINDIQAGQWDDYLKKMILEQG